MSNRSGEVVDQSEYKDNPRDQWKLWQQEIAKAFEEKESWRNSGKTIDNAFLARGTEGRKLNLFTANTLTTMALSYGKVPTVDVKRRFDDQDDPTARCAATILQRILNTDIQRDSDTYKTAIKLALKDRLLPGLGNVRAFYTVQFSQPKKIPAQYKTDPATGLPAIGPDGEPVVLAPEYTEPPRKIYEEADIDYAHWEDQIWCAGARTFSEVRWWGFAADMTREQLVERFGEKIGKAVSLKGGGKRSDDVGSDRLVADPWSRAKVWEIWDKTKKRVIWWCEGHEEILDSKPDPLGLEGFWPFPMPLMANTTNSAFIPRPDYVLAQDQYIKINELDSKIDLLQKAIRVAGVYNGANAEISKLLQDQNSNKLYAVPNWALHAEKGGIKGQIDWLPLEAIVAALEMLRQARQEEIALLYQVTGLSDIMRGQGTAPATATEQAIKAKFAGVRTQDFQDEFARFASDAQWIRAQIICKHFDAEEILKRSNIMATDDGKQFGQQAVELLKSDLMKFRVEVKPESISMADYATLKQERVEMMQGLAQILTAFMPIGQAAPMLLPVLIGMLRWMFAGFRGAAQIELELTKAEQMIQKMVQAQMNAPPKEDPQVEREKIKTAALKEKVQGDLAVNQAKVQGHLITAQADMQKAEHDAQMDTRRMMMDAQREALGLNHPQNGAAPNGNDQGEVR